MVGRQPELSRLRALWDEASAGAGRLVLIAGEPGVGKTRLATELQGTVDTGEARVLVGHCERDVPEPYQPFIEALAPVLHEASDEWVRDHAGRHGPGLGLLFPELASRLGAAAPQEQPGPRTRLFGAVAGSVAAPGGQPVLLVLEDLHWATPSTVALLQHLIHHPPARARLLVVGTYRDAAINPSHPLATFLDDRAGGRLERIFLANLSPQAITALLVDHAAVAGKAAAALAETLWRQTQGNPLLVTEVVRDLAAAGALSTGAVDAKVLAKVGLAHDIPTILHRRLGRPAADDSDRGVLPVRATVEAAAVVGTTFSLECVAHLCARRPQQVQASLAKAAAAAVIVPAGDDPGTYRFAHDAMRDALLEALPPNRFVALHHELARFLEDPDRTAAVAPVVLLHHRTAATPVGRSPEAVGHARTAGQAAMHALAFDEAATFFGQALAFHGTVEDPLGRVDLLLQLAEANRLAGESARARQAYLQSAALATLHQDGPRMARSVLGLGEVLAVWGSDGLLIGLLEEALAANPEDPAIRAKLLSRLAQARARLDTPDQLKATSDRAWELAWDSQDADTMGSVLRARHEALSAPDDLEDRVEIDGELYAMASSAKDPDLGLLAHGWRLADLLEQGHLIDADRDRKLHAQLARRSGDPHHLADAEAWAATWALLEGRSRQAATHIDKALTLAQEARDPEASSTYWVQQLGLILDWGSAAEIDGLVDVWRDLVRSHEDAPAWRATLALLLATSGQHEEAATHLDELLADGCADLGLDRAWLPTVAALGETAALLGDGRAPALAKRLRPYSRRMIVLGRGHLCRGSVERVLGLLWASSGNWAEAERHFQAALSVHERVGVAPLVARTRWELGQALGRQTGGKLHAGRVKTTLAQASEEAGRLGMTRLVEGVSASQT